VRAFPVRPAAENHKVEERSNDEVGSSNQYGDTQSALNSEREANSMRGWAVAATRRFKRLVPKPLKGTQAEHPCRPFFAHAVGSRALSARGFRHVSRAGSAAGSSGCLSGFGARRLPSHGA
jgi:hypothetical protein